jgi:predicted dithiol-disulfide oxidoreductase (DUF899 family)
VAAREKLRLAEIDLMRRCEHVAELRRALPGGAVDNDYMFEEGPRTSTMGTMHFTVSD